MALIIAHFAKIFYSCHVKASDTGVLMENAKRQFLSIIVLLTSLTAADLAWAAPQQNVLVSHQL